MMYPYVSACISMYDACTRAYMEFYSISLRQDFVSFIPPLPHYRGTRAAFSPSIDDCWYGRVNLIFKMRVRTDAGGVMVWQRSLIETL